MKKVGFSVRVICFACNGLLHSVTTSLSDKPACYGVHNTYSKANMGEQVIKEGFRCLRDSRLSSSGLCYSLAKSAADACSRN